mmetsp:Transcript_46463/g.88718  ORF Transcript_46463/g.88718 Transcript_46463/m.88718 type:complete len:214 (-) Transcript_46463:98-739(-)
MVDEHVHAAHRNRRHVHHGVQQLRVGGDCAFVGRVLVDGHSRNFYVLALDVDVVERSVSEARAPYQHRGHVAEANHLGDPSTVQGIAVPPPAPLQQPTAGDSNVMQMGRRNKVMTYVLTRHIHVQRCGLLYSKFLVGGGEVDGDAGNVMPGHDSMTIVVGTGPREENSPPAFLVSTRSKSTHNCGSIVRNAVAFRTKVLHVAQFITDVHFQVP